MREYGVIIAGGAAGAAIPLIIREYVDKTTPPAAGFDWKKPSALVGLIGGAAATAIGIFGSRWVGPTISTALVAAGPAMMVTGAYSAMFPKGTETGTPAGLRFTASKQATTAGTKIF